MLVLFHYNFNIPVVQGILYWIMSIASSGVQILFFSKTFH